MFKFLISAAKKLLSCCGCSTYVTYGYLLLTENFYVPQGILFSAQTPHILMLGNPIVHWMILILMMPVAFTFIVDAVRTQRAKAYYYSNQKEGTYSNR